MKLKSLLLGSAAALVAVSGARAADAIVVEPEPVEYVRVCDAYGAGWFYIPGTETCLKFEGDVRLRYTARHFHADQADETSAHDADYRARLVVRANNETEYGTLASRFRLSGGTSAGRGTGVGGGHNDTLSRSEGPGSAGVVINRATISLSGFFMGFDDNYWSRNGAYGYYDADRDGQYNFRNGLFIEYTYAANNMAFTVGGEDGNTSGEAGAPDLYAGVAFGSPTGPGSTAGSYYLSGTYYHDSSSGSGAYKIRADYALTDAFAIGGWWASDEGETDYVKGHIWGVTAGYRMSDTLRIYAGYSVFEDNYFDNRSAGICDAAGAVRNNECNVDTGLQQYTVGVRWDVVPGLFIAPEYVAFAFDRPTATRQNYGEFLVRVVRSF